MHRVLCIYNSMNNDRLRFNINEETPSIRSNTLFKKKKEGFKFL